ncbi:MAG: MopE-related protein [archaeon]
MKRGSATAVAILAVLLMIVAAAGIKYAGIGKVTGAAAGNGGDLAKLTGAATVNGEGYVEVNTPFSVYSVAQYADRWGSCGTDSEWASVVWYCRCLGYKQAPPRDKNPCYNQYDSLAWIWDADTRCPPSKGNHGSANALTKIKCEPYASESDCSDSIDNDADGLTDCADSDCDAADICGTTFYLDYDSDGYGNATKTIHAVNAPQGYVSTSGDCNDGNAAVHPGATEICNGLDDNCNGPVDEGGVCNDVNNCGVYGYACTKGANVAAVACNSGTCAITQCVQGFNDTDRSFANGCEQNLQNNAYAEVNTTLGADMHPWSWGCAPSVCPIWTDCSSVYGGWNAANNFCKCEGYSGALDSSKYPCYEAEAPMVEGKYEYKRVYEWDTSTCPVQAGSWTGGSTTLRKVKCIADEEDCTKNTEICNGKDDNCNSLVDEGDVCKTVDNCGVYGHACTKGANVDSLTCSFNASGARACRINGCNAGFAECDGNYGNGCEVNTNTNINNCGSCNNVCAKGANVSSVACNSGACAITLCVQGFNDTDRNFANGCEAEINVACAPQEIQSCYTGPANTTGVGPCKAGTKTCAANGKSWGACANETKPATETCNGIDDNCDGMIDNMTESMSCGDGICAGGAQTRTCADGNYSAWSACSTDSKKTTETCNGLDDDCNGVIDNGMTPLKAFYKDNDGDSFGNKKYPIQACAAPPNYANNSLDCNDANSAINPAATEICIDSVDNNCNNLTDSASEGCGQQASTSLQKQIIATPVAGNKICEAGETQETTPVDCGCPEGQELVGAVCQETNVNQICGDGIAEGAEDCDVPDDSQCPGNCKEDCTCPFIVKDGKCDKENGETSENSPEDCSFKFSGLLWIVSATIALVGACTGYWYFRIKPKTTLSSVAELEGLGSPERAETPAEGKAQEDAEANIESYIHQTASMGFAPDKIKAALVERGWDVDVIDEKFKSAGVDQSKLHGIADARGVGTPTEDISKVDGYISHCLKDGYTPVQIKTALVSSGWTEKVVDEALANNKTAKAGMEKIAKKTKVEKLTHGKKKNTKRFAEESLKAGQTLRQIAETLEKEDIDLSKINKKLGA